MIRVCTETDRSQAWIEQYRGCPPVFACVLGFTETGLIPGISAAGATPADRQYTALADAEFLYHGATPNPKYSLPPLDAGASPVFISRALLAAQQIPITIFNAGLPHSPSVPHIDLKGMPARCLRHGNAMDLAIVQHLFQRGLHWGEQLATQAAKTKGYVILSECVVGGTTTALAVLTGLGWSAAGKVNSSHPTCNHQQKWEIVQEGLKNALQQNTQQKEKSTNSLPTLYSPRSTPSLSPFPLIAAIGDPMQITIAGMTIAASRRGGVLLAGGTQMLAVYALVQTIAHANNLPWRPEQVMVGTTRWVANDPTGDTVGLAKMLNAPLIASQLSFAASRYRQLRAYEQGYVKEGVGAGGCAIAASLYRGWNSMKMLETIENLAKEYEQVRKLGASESV
jgi:uncharacterized protein (TIGR00303 family)